MSEPTEHQLSLSPTVVYTPVQLARELVAYSHQPEALIELVAEMDREIADWDFTVLLARKVAEMLLQLADEEEDVPLSIHVHALLTQLASRDED